MKKKDLGRSSLWGWYKKCLRIMRLTILLVLGFVFYASGSIYSQTTKLSMDIQNTTLSELIQQIESQTKYVFLYQAKVEKTVKLTT